MSVNNFAVRIQLDFLIFIRIKFDWLFENTRKFDIRQWVISCSFNRTKLSKIHVSTFMFYVYVKNVKIFVTDGNHDGISKHD